MTPPRNPTMTPRSTKGRGVSTGAEFGEMMHTLGRLVEGQEHAAEGRKVLHTRLDDVGEKLDKLAEYQLQTATQIAELGGIAKLAISTAAQTRDGFDAFKREVSPVMEDVKELQQQNKDEIVPLLASVRTVRNIAGFFAGLAATGVFSLGAVLTFFNAAARDAVRAWLGV